MKKGFTLIELIAVIALLGIVMTITAMSILNVRKSTLKTLCEQKVKYIEDGATKWGDEHLNGDDTFAPLNSKNCADVPINLLITNGYIKGDNSNSDGLIVPGSNNVFSGTTCVKYENILPSNIGSYADNYGYDDKYRNWQVTAKYKGTECN